MPYINYCTYLLIHFYGINELIWHNLKEEEKKIRRELETLKINYIEEKKKSVQLTVELNNAKMELQNFKVSKIL